MLEKLYKPKDTPMQVAIFMSGSGTNAIKLLDHQRKLEARDGSPFRISTIVTDNQEKGNNARSIATDFGLPEPIFEDFRKFRRENIKDPKDLSERAPYFEKLVNRLQDVKPAIDFIALAGYELIVTEPLLSAFNHRIVNVHPADLSIRNGNGSPKYVGNQAVRDAILANEEMLRASTHIVMSSVDEGPVLLVSQPVKVDLGEMTIWDLVREEYADRLKAVAKEHQDRLKKVGDWNIFPLTLELLSAGRFESDKKGMLYFDSQPMPYGFKIENLLRSDL